MKKSLRKCAGPPYISLAKLLTPLAFAAVLAGCGAISKHAEATAPQYMAASETTAAAYNTYDAPAAAYDYGENYGEEGEAYPQEFAAEDAAEVTGSSSINPVSPVGRKLIRSVSMNVETDAFDQVVKHLQEKVTELSGYIEQSDISGSSLEDPYNRSGRYASITARIPSTSLDQFIAVVEGSGNMTYKSETTQDVTLQYSDLESRKKTLTVEQDRIWSLLEKADTLEAVIALEERLSQIRYELESMESRLRLYDNQVEYSTINIRINEKTVIEFTPTAPETVGQRIKKGFAKNVQGVIETFTNLFIFFVTASPVWIPLAVLAVLITILVNRRTKKKLKRTASSQAASEHIDEMNPKE